MIHASFRFVLAKLSNLLFNHRAYPVGVFAFGRAVFYILFG
jgi:hypothetical protein